MRIEISRLHFPVTVLGYGTRAGIWVQGCSIGCAQCVSRDTWAPQPDAALDVDQLVSWVESLPDRDLDGVTISGGEPFDQPEALAELLAAFRRLSDERVRRSTGPLDVLCYSGYALERLQRHHADLLALVDVLVSDPYVDRRQSAAPLRGSDNQRLSRLSALGDERYGEAQLEAMGAAGFQVAADHDAIWYIGIPRRGDMTRLQELMAARGVTQEVTSWQA